MTRKLSLNEIQSILTIVFETISRDKLLSYSFETFREHMRQELLKITIYPEMIPNLIKEISKQIEESFIHPGESIGIIAAQSIGERQTQMTLNTFHTAGEFVSTVITGVPRFTELLNATKNPKILHSFIQFSNSYKNIRDIRESIHFSFIQISLKQLCIFKQINEPGYTEPWFDVFSSVYKIDIPCNKWSITMICNKKHILEYEISLHYVSKRIQQEFDDIQCIWSSDNCKMIVYIDISKDALEKMNTNEFIYIENLCNILFKIDVLKHEKNSNIYDFQFTKLNNTWGLTTNGSNLQYLYQYPWVSFTETYSNDMWEIYYLFGIEAVYQFLIEEFTNIIQYDGTYINDCHIHVVVSIMTFDGIITAISRYGMKSDTGVLNKCSYEESVENFIYASIYSKTDNTKGVSASVICGKEPLIGSNLCGLKMNI